MTIKLLNSIPTQKHTHTCKYVRIPTNPIIHPSTSLPTATYEVVTPWEVWGGDGKLSGGLVQPNLPPPFPVVLSGPREVVRDAAWKTKSAGEDQFFPPQPSKKPGGREKTLNPFLTRTRGKWKEAQ